MSSKEEQEKASRAQVSIATFMRLRGTASTFAYTQDPAAFSTAPAGTALKIAYGSESRHQFLHLRLPEGHNSHSPAGAQKLPVIVTIHGGFWKRQFGLGYFEPLALALSKELKVATVNIEYRRAPADPDWPASQSDEFCEDERVDSAADKIGGWPATVQDVCKAVGFVSNVLAERYGLDRERLVVTGHSAGGHLTGLVAGIAAAAFAGKDEDEDAGLSEKYKSWFGVTGTQDVPIKSAVVLAGVMDLLAAYERQVGGNAAPNFMGIHLDGRDEARASYKEASPVTYIPSLFQRTRLHLIQGTDDDDVPVWNAREFMGLAKSALAKNGIASDRVQATYIEGSGHFPMVDPQEGGAAWETTVGVLRGAL